MRRMLVNALSVTNPSGRYVLLGHLRQLVEELKGRMAVLVLGRDDLDLECENWAAAVERIPAPGRTKKWLPRVLWERMHLVTLMRRHGATLYFTPSGMAARLPPDVKQMVFCQNPWALVPAARRLRDAPKAWLQRRAYRRSMQAADVLIFNSRYMQQVYRANASCRERRGLVVYQAVGDDARMRAAQCANRSRRSWQILCVSVMAPHKNVETLLYAFARLRMVCPETNLVLAGSWPDPVYERRIRALVRKLKLTDAVVFTGFVDRCRLEELYAESRIFCLMSRCESFGIPAIEAQLFGTPVVSSTVCAIPEICGDGGLFCDPDDEAGIAAALQRLLVDGLEWSRRSDLARGNAARFVWSTCSRPLVDLVDRTVSKA